MEVDYIVVGAGAAGCVLAHRLSEDPAVRVLLVERGGRGRHPLLRIPKGFLHTMRSRRYASHYETEPVGPDRQRETWVRGKVLGGSTAINGMVYLRGDARDHDALAQAGNPGWGWARMLGAYKALEDHQLGASPERGSGGPLPVGITELDDDVTPAVLAAAGALGVPEVPDVNAVQGVRIGATPATIRGGLRVSAARAFLHPVRRRPNLVVAPRSCAERLLFEGDRVVGVRTRARGRTVDHRARAEVVLAAGTVESPLLLERSGIGDPEVLDRAGIRTRVASPHVGERVLEQRGLVVKARLRAGAGHGPRLDSPAKRLRAGARHLVTRRGPVGTAAYELAANLSTAGDPRRPDAQVLATPLATDATGVRVAPYPGLMVLGYPLRPTTRGAVHVTGPGLDDPPSISPDFLHDDAERRTTTGILRWVRELLATPPLAALVDEEVAPGVEVVGDDDIVRYALRTGSGIYHAVGSCGMGPDADAVVDSRLAVRGVEGLRVADASVFPDMPSGATAAPTMVAAWLAADVIAEG